MNINVRKARSCLSMYLIERSLGLRDASQFPRRDSER